MDYKNRVLLQIRKEDGVFVTNITENGGVTSKYCAGLCAKGKNKLATEIQVHTVWKGTITRRNSAKACVQRENTVQTAVGIGMRHHRRNA